LRAFWDWVGGVVLTVAFAAIFLANMTYDWLADKSPYPFTDAEMRRWNVDGRVAPVSLLTQVFHPGCRRA
jgi:hypothetical protein